MTQAQGEFLYLLSDDDVLLPGAIAKLLELIADHPDFDAFALNSRPFTHSPDEATEGIFRLDGDRTIPTRDGALVFLNTHITFLSCIAFRRANVLGKDYTDKVGTVLIQAFFFVDALAPGRGFYVTQQPFLAQRADNNQGFDFFQVFVTNFDRVLRYARHRGYSEAAVRQVRAKVLKFVCYIIGVFKTKGALGTIRPGLSGRPPAPVARLRPAPGSAAGHCPDDADTPAPIRAAFHTAARPLPPPPFPARSSPPEGSRMRTLLVLLVAANVAAPLWLSLRSCVSRRGLEINHVLIFSVGFVTYWILPIGVGLTGLARGLPQLQIWTYVFDDVPEAGLACYLLVTLGCFLAFWAGDAWMRRRMARRVRVYHRTFFYPLLLEVPLAFGLLGEIVYGFALRGQFFTGYAALIQEGTNTDATRGSFIAFSVFLLSLALVYTMRRAEMGREGRPFAALLRNRYVALYALFAVLVLSLGGRLYFVSSVVMLLVYRTVYFRRLSGRAALLLTLVGATASGVIGVTRLGGSAEAAGLVQSLLGEPLLTSLSLLRFVQDGYFEWLKFPVFLLSSFLNLVPSAVLPNKVDLILDPSQAGYVIFSPVGALNSYVSFMVNFGILGTALCFFGLAASLRFLALSDSRLLSRVIYVMVCGWLGSTFFRDPFLVSIVKNIFQFSILTPLAIVLAAQVASVALRAYLSPPGAAREPAAPAA